LVGKGLHRNVFARLAKKISDFKRQGDEVIPDPWGVKK